MYCPLPLREEKSVKIMCLPLLSLPQRSQRIHKTVVTGRISLDLSFFMHFVC